MEIITEIRAQHVFYNHAFVPTRDGFRIFVTVRPEYARAMCPWVFSAVTLEKWENVVNEHDSLSHFTTMDDVTRGTRLV